MGCLQFFRQKEVAGKDQVGKVAWNLQDSRVQDWYSNECDRFNALTFAEFIKEVRSYWLSSNWADIVRQKVLSSTQGDKAFCVWAAEVQNRNVLLRGELSRLPEEQLRFHLESRMHLDVLAEYRVAQISEEKDFRKWIEKVCTLDEKRLKDIARQKVAVEEAVRASRMFQPSCSANAKTSKAARTRRRVLVPPHSLRTNGSYYATTLAVISVVNSSRTTPQRHALTTFPTRRGTRHSRRLMSRRHTQRNGPNRSLQCLKMNWLPSVPVYLSRRS